MKGYNFFIVDMSLVIYIYGIMSIFLCIDGEFFVVFLSYFEILSK